MTEQPQHSPQEAIENQKWVFDRNREFAQREHDKLDSFHTYTNEAAIKSSELALRMALIINGGAAVSLLTFIGSLPKEQKRLLADTLVWFASGVALAVAAIGLAYFTHFFMAGIASSRVKTWQHPFIVDGPTTKRNRRINLGFHIAAVVVGLASLVVFVMGMMQVRDALARLG